VGPLTGYFDVEAKDILQELEELQKVLTHLRYEGKVSLGKNLKSARQLMARLVTHLGRHRQLQERVVFPYLAAHIPRHESVIQFLRSDHADIRKSKERLQAVIRNLLKNPESCLEHVKIQELGVYLICLVRHHIELEKKSIHRALDEELRPVERRKVETRVRQWLCLHKNRNNKRLNKTTTMKGAVYA